MPETPKPAVLQSPKVMIWIAAAAAGDWNSRLVVNRITTNFNIQNQRTAFMVQIFP